MQRTDHDDAADEAEQHQADQGQADPAQPLPGLLTLVAERPGGGDDGLAQGRDDDPVDHHADDEQR